MRTLIKILSLAMVSCSLAGVGETAEASVGSLHPGLRNIATKAYSPAIMNAEIFANMWRSWDKPSRDAAEKASSKARREMTLKRYGLVEAPYDNGGAPLGLVVGTDGDYALSCMICHSGNVSGQTILGAPNSALEFSGLFEDAAATVTLLHGNKPGNPDFPEGLLFLSKERHPKSVEFPDGLMSVSRGTFNSFTFSVHFLSLRDRDLNLLETPLDLKPLTHYIDPPPLWNVAKKKRLYTDGFTPKSVRSLMQFSLDPSFGPALFKSWEDDYKDIYAWIESLQSPKYPGPIDRRLAARGQEVYSSTCAACHGTPGPTGEYKNLVVPIEVVQTDRSRLDGLSPEFRKHFSESWMGYYGSTDIPPSQPGYVAPPLDGVWASAPYFHNGSVPTLYHVLFPDERPTVWKVKDYSSYDYARVGLPVEERAKVPETHTLLEKREYYDATRPTMSNAGHRFAEVLSKEQRLSLLEYLKTL